MRSTVLPLPTESSRITSYPFLRICFSSIHEWGRLGGVLLWLSCGRCGSIVFRFGSADKKILGRLDELQGRWHWPFAIKIPPCSHPERSNYGSGAQGIDGTLFHLFRPESPHKKGYRGYSARARTMIRKQHRKNWNYSKTSKNHSYSGVVERYQRLRWSMRKGNTNKKSLIVKGFLAPEHITTLTPIGVRWLRPFHL